MNVFQQFVSVVNDNKKQIITRTLITAAAVVGVTLASGLLKVTPAPEAVEAVEAVTKAAKKAVE